MKKIFSLFAAVLVCSWAMAAKSMSYYHVDGALYYGTNSTATAYTTQYMFVPYADSVPVVSQVGPGTWYGGKGHVLDSTSIGSDTYWIYAPANINYYVMYLPYFQSDDKDNYDEWQWGGVTKYRAGARMRIGSGKKAFLCAPQYHPDSLASGGNTFDFYMRSGSLKGQAVRYFYGSMVGDEEQGYYNHIGSYIHTNGVVWADSIFVPIYSYAIYKDGAPKTKATIFGKNGRITLSIYSATKAEDGSPIIDRTHPIYQATADSTNFLWNNSTAYKGAITFVKKGEGNQIVPFVSEGGDFYAEFSGFNESGMDFGLYSDGYPVKGQANGQAWLYKDGKFDAVWDRQYDLYITFYGFFPFIRTAYGAEEVNIDATGEKVSVIYPKLDPAMQERNVLWVHSNRDFSEWEVNKPDWVTLKYDTANVWESNNFTSVIFVAEPNEGAAREGQITFTHHAISKTVTIKQEAKATGFIDLFDRKDQQNVNKFLHNGQLIIRKGDKLYNAVGAEF